MTLSVPQKAFSVVIAIFILGVLVCWLFFISCIAFLPDKGTFADQPALLMSVFRLYAIFAIVTSTLASFFVLIRPFDWIIGRYCPLYFARALKQFIFRYCVLLMISWGAITWWLVQGDLPW